MCGGLVNMEVGVQVNRLGKPSSSGKSADLRVDGDELGFGLGMNRERGREESGDGEIFEMVLFIAVRSVAAFVRLGTSNNIIINMERYELEELLE